MPTNQKADLHQTLTAKIVAAIEAGAGSWQMPWHRPGTAFATPKNALTEAAYQGCNILSLWNDADSKGCCAMATSSRRRAGS